MNAQRFRIIFNKARNLLMVVAEHVVGQGKNGTRKRNRRAAGGAATSALASSIGFLLVLPTMASAQIVPDQSAATANQRAGVTAAPNGVPLINIQTPSASGLSHNIYSQFSTSNGAIFNNSRSAVQTSIGGWIIGNPNLSTGSARVILNEVNSNNPSVLRGFLEVAGQRAQVIVANPAGVTCDGCGFINANRATLTTGVPLISGGALDGFRVERGAVNVTGEGLDSRGADYTDIIARSTVINGGVWGKQINLITGSNQVGFEAETGTTVVRNNLGLSEGRPAFAVDVSQLGGMYANKIALIGTEAGVGVRSAGLIGAYAGELKLSANGNLENTGKLFSSDAITLDMGGVIENRGDIGAGAVTLKGNDLRNAGGLYSLGDLAISVAGDANNAGVTQANRGLTIAAKGSIENTGKVAAVDKLSLESGAATRNSGEMAAGALALNSSSLRNEGSLSSLEDITVSVSGITRNTGTLQANRSASIKSGDVIVNAGSIAGGTSLALTAATIQNDSAGELSAPLLVLDASVASNPSGGGRACVTLAGITCNTPRANSILNRGLIDGQDTRIDAQVVSNVASGRIFGDAISIATAQLFNTGEAGQSPVIASRGDLDIGASDIENSGQANLLSMGNMTLGGLIYDQNRRAFGQGYALINRGATIESMGDISLSFQFLRNENANLTTAEQLISQELIREGQGQGSPIRYREGTPGAYVFWDESWHLRTPEGDYSRWTGYQYTRTVTETRVTSTNPGRIIAGGNITGNGVNAVNDNSEIIAGGVIRGEGASLTNTGLSGKRTTIDSGIATSYWRIYQRGTDAPGMAETDYLQVAEESIPLTPWGIQENAGSGASRVAVPARTMHGLRELSRDALMGPSQDQMNAVAAAPRKNNNYALYEVPAATGDTSQIIRTNDAAPVVSNSSLFTTSTAANAPQLVETDKRFTNKKEWLGSEYLLNALNIQPTEVEKRLGDGFYEQKIVREQVSLLTGKRFLSGFSSDEVQFKSLMNNAVTFAREHSLRPGVELSAEQMAQLTSDIVWLVEKTVTLPDGTIARALVPQVYVRVSEGDLLGSGALIAGKEVLLNLSGDLVNSGVISGANSTVVRADNIKNMGGRVQGGELSIEATRDFINRGGELSASNNLTVIAGNNLSIESTTSTQSTPSGSVTNIDSVAGVYVTGSSGSLQLLSGADMTLTAAVISNTGKGSDSSTVIAAGNNLTMNTVTQVRDTNLVWSEKNKHSDSSSTDIGTTVKGAADVLIIANKNIDAHAVKLVSDEGALEVKAAGNISLTAGEQRDTVDEYFQQTSKGFLSKKTTTTAMSLDQSQAIASLLSGQTTTVIAGNNLEVVGSNVVSTDGTVLGAKNITIKAAEQTTDSHQFTETRKSGLLSSGGVGFTVGTQKKSNDLKGHQTTSAASTVGSTDGSVVIQAEQAFEQIGSHVMAPKGDIDISAKTVSITEAQNTSNVVQETKFKQSGLTVAVSAPVISALQTAQQMGKAAGQTDDSRMQALALANVGMSSVSAFDATKKALADGDKTGGVQVSVTLGKSQSQSKTTTNSTKAVGSTITAGGDVTITASGAGKDSDLIIQGSDLKAGNNATLKADGDVILRAAKNTVEQKSTSSSNSSGVGVAASVGKQSYAGVTLSASAARGNADGNDQTWTNTHVEAGNTLTISSGGDTTIKGATGQGKKVVADVGGDLLIESLQDTSTYNSKNQSVSGSVTVGYGNVGGSLSVAKSNVNSDYASVTQQSGLKAGDEGFSVNVANDTTLTGGAITSTQAAIDGGKNSFSTGGELTTSDIQNKASYTAKSVSVSAGATPTQQGGYAAAAAAGLGNDSGSASSVTKAAISGVAGNKEARTGDAETGIASIFDADRVQKEVDAQTAITQMFGQNASKAIGDYAAQQEKKASDLRTQATTETDPDKRAALQAQADKLDADWGPNGSLRLAAHTVVGGLTGGVQGALGAAGGTLAAPTVAQALTDAGIDPALGEIITAAASTATGAALGGAAGAGAALNEVVNNFLSHPEAAKRAAAEQKKRQCKDDACRQQAQQEIDHWNKLDNWRDEQIEAACAKLASAACQSWNAALQYAKITYKGYDEATDRSHSIRNELRQVNEQAFLYGQAVANPYLHGVGKGLLKLTPPGALGEVVTGTVALTNAILEDGLVDTAINIAKGIKELPGEMRARLNSDDPAVRGEALVDVLALGVGGTTVVAKLGQVGGGKFAKLVNAGADSNTPHLTPGGTSKVGKDIDAANDSVYAPANGGKNQDLTPGAGSGNAANTAANAARLNMQLAAEQAAGARAPTQITGYSSHALEQIAGRDGGIGVNQSAMTNAWSNPLKIEYVPSKYGPTFRYTGADAVIVVNAEGKVVTGWAKSSSGVGK